MTLLVGLIGLGFGEQVLHKALLRTRGIRPVMVAASSSEKARAASGRMNIPKWTGRWQKLVDDPSVQAVVMALPPALQCSVARRALQLGKPVFCEKPLAPTEREAASLAAQARRSGAVCAVDFEFPELPLWCRAKTLLRAGRVGRLRSVAVRWRVQTYAVKMDMKSWKTEVRAGGGALQNFASHTFHYLEWFAGPIVRLNCRLSRAAGLKRIQGETAAELWAETRDGVPLNVQIVTHACGIAEHEIVFQGSKGALVLRNEGRDYAAGFRLFWRSADLAETELSAGSSRQRSKNEDGRIAPVASLMLRWAKAVRGGKSCAPGFEEGLRVQRLIAKARQSHQTGRRVNCG